MLEAKLLSKVLDEQNFFILKKYNITESDFTTYGKVFSYIERYVKQHGQTPDYRTVVAEFEDFDYMGEVADAFSYLCKEIKVARGLNESFSFLEKKVPQMFDKGRNKNFVSDLYEEVSRMYRASTVTSHVGSNYAENGAERKKRYQENKERQSEEVVPTPYNVLNEFLHLELTDYLLIQAFSNVGKSWIASHIGTHAWSKGFNIIHYSPELSQKQQEARNDTLLGKYNNVGIRTGELDNEDQYYDFLDQFADNEAFYQIKTMEHLPDGLTVDAIEADLQQNPETKVVIIDGFNLIQHGKGKVDRNAMTQTSRRLRQMFGRHKVLGIVVHQVNANEERENKKGDEDEVDERIPKPASILGYSETLAVVQDASHILSFDAVDGMGALQLVKTRGEGKDRTVDLHLNFNLGMIREVTPIDSF
ncbi:DnaB-like helicase C-terminal domain-containing protein [Halobacillus karajensis]|uniref:DnaB-like helicase C-terminal domain-containing protein n=1 Tax=Halobacillus karajensis TaxID=195088 RepID=UPI00045CF962|nr:DnaB-like helicase C-terminal domain-containing protein [Halobacillus karajensis]CDQ21719.1 phage replicative helicase, DnaB family [Halobacillus karajensis]